MKQRFIDFGERVTGKPIPPDRQTVLEWLRGDYDSTLNEITMTQVAARRDRRQWWLEAGREGGKEVLLRSVGMGVMHAAELVGDGLVEMAFDAAAIASKATD